MNPRLTKERAAELLAYDPLTGLLTWKVRVGQRGLAGQVAGGLNARGYVYVGIEGRGYFAHRVAWLLHYGVWPTTQIDHIDCDKTNNRITNLRDVAGTVNIQNQHAPRANNKLGIRGVSKNSKGFQAEILTDGVRQYLGTFATPEQAQSAYLRAKKEQHACCV